MTATIYGVSTALPEHTADQDQSLEFMRRVICARTAGIDQEQALMVLEAIHEGSGIDRRYSVIEDFTRNAPQQFTFFPSNWRLEPFPTTRQRMKVYETEAVALAERAGADALADAGVAPEEVTHLVYVTCTGLFAPGPDVLLVDRLGLRGDVRRTVIGFMGCYGAFNGLRTADQIVGADPQAVVLQINVELCTLHYQQDVEPETLVSNTLFADGAAAVVAAGQDRLDDAHCRLDTTDSRVAADSLDQMRWDIGDTGFAMGLDRSVPETIGDGAGRFVDGLLDRARLHRDEVGAWLVHPGGPRILDAVGDAVELDEDQLALSRSVLRDFGNMSSPSVLFALRRQLDQNRAAGPMAMLGFGPGLTMEGAVFRTG